MKALKRVSLYYFSPTGSTARIGRAVARMLAHDMGLPCAEHSYTLPAERQQLPPIEEGDLVVWATPVYAGRMPNKLLDFVRQHMQGNGGPLVGVATFGGRHFDQVLDELTALAYEGHLQPYGMMAVATRHAFSRRVGHGTLWHAQVAALRKAVDELGWRMQRGEARPLPPVPMPTSYYRPLRADGQAANFLKAKPVVDLARCTQCGICTAHCPMGSLQMADGMPRCEGVCIKCQACVQHCPQGAVGFEDEDFLSHVQMLEQSVVGEPPFEVRMR